MIEIQFPTEMPIFEIWKCLYPTFVAFLLYFFGNEKKNDIVCLLSTINQEFCIFSMILKEKFGILVYWVF